MAVTLSEKKLSQRQAKRCDHRRPLCPLPSPAVFASLGAGAGSKVAEMYSMKYMRKNNSSVVASRAVVQDAHQHVQVSAGENMSMNAQQRQRRDMCKRDRQNDQPLMVISSAYLQQAPSAEPLPSSTLLATGRLTRGRGRVDFQRGSRCHLIRLRWSASLLVVSCARRWLVCVVYNYGPGPHCVHTVRKKMSPGRGLIGIGSYVSHVYYKLAAPRIVFFFGQHLSREY